MAKRSAKQDKKVPKLPTKSPLNILYRKRRSQNRDLKIVTTARDGQTGVGKSMLNFWLALNWNPGWRADDLACHTPERYIELYGEAGPGSVVLMEEAEQFDARRSQQEVNVKISQFWQMGRKKEITTLMTLPSPDALDKRLKTLSDIWINIHRRGLARAYGVKIDDHSGKKYSWKLQDIEFPNLDWHPEYIEMENRKDEMIDQQINNDANPSPKEVEKQTKIEIAQKLRNQGKTLREIKDTIDYSICWISNNTTPP